MLRLSLEVRSQDEPTNPRVVKYRWRLLAIFNDAIISIVVEELASSTKRGRALSLGYDSNCSSQCGVMVSTRHCRDGEIVVRIRALYCALYNDMTA